MSKVLRVYVDDDAEKRLEMIERETGRTLEDLASSAVEEAACSAFRSRNDDPARKPASAVGPANSLQASFK